MPHPGGAAHEMGYFNPNPPREWKTAWGRVPRYALYPSSLVIPGKPPVYVHPWQLAKCYSVDLEDCMVVRDNELAEPWNKGLRDFVATLPALRPRPDGNYSLPDGVMASDSAQPPLTLGSRQRAVLQMMNPEWVSSVPGKPDAESLRVLESLEARGLVYRNFARWIITDAGRAAAGVPEAPVHPTTYGPNCIPQTPTASPVGVMASDGGQP